MYGGLSQAETPASITTLGGTGVNPVFGRAASNSYGTFEATAADQLLGTMSSAAGFAVHPAQQGPQQHLHQGQAPSHHERWLLFEVMDTGIGIAREGLAALFKEYVQVRLSVVSLVGDFSTLFLWLALKHAM
jgi:N-methylhydantoinase B/oxoprolinase/acetone carboxylase alpha subunit